MELEARGAKVNPIFAGGLDFSGPVEKFFIDPVTKKPMINSAVSLTRFALVAGPARQDHPRAVEALSKINVPYIVALPLVFQTTKEWLNSILGLHPIQVEQYQSLMVGWSPLCLLAVIEEQASPIFLNLNLKYSFVSYNLACLLFSDV